MTIEQINIGDQWRKLNMEINGHERTLAINIAAGVKPTDEYMQWLEAKKALRNELQTKF